MSQYRKSLAPYATGSSTISKPTMQSSRSTTTSQSSRKSLASSRTTMIQAPPDLKQHEARILTISTKLIPQFLHSTRFQGVIPQPFSYKNIRFDEFLNIYAHIMKQIDPTFKIEQPWDIQFEYISKSYGYPFSIPSKSSIASFDVSDATRKSLSMCLTWFIQFILYFQDVFSPNGLYSYSDQAPNDEGDLDPVTTFHLIRKNYHLWLKTGNDNVIAQELVQSSLSVQDKLTTQIETLQKEENDLTQSLQQFNNINNEIIQVQQRIAELQAEIQKEDDLYNAANVRVVRMQAKVVEKQQIVSDKEDEIATSQQFITNLNQIISQQAQTEDDFKNLRKQLYSYQQQTAEHDATIQQCTNDINTVQQALIQSLCKTREHVIELNRLQTTINKSYYDNDNNNNNDNNSDDSVDLDGSRLEELNALLLEANITSTTSFSKHSTKSSSLSSSTSTTPTTKLKLNQFHVLNDNEIQEYIQQYSKVQNINPKSNQSIDITVNNQSLVDSLTSITTSFKSTKQFITMQDPTLPPLFKSHTPESIEQMKVQISQSKRLLSTTIFSTNQEITSLDREISHIQSSIQQCNTQIEWIQSNMKEMNDSINEKNNQYNIYVRDFDQQYNSLLTNIQELRLSEDQLHQVKKVYKSIRNELDVLAKSHSHEEAYYSQILTSLCTDLQAHFNNTTKMVDDCHHLAVHCKQTLYQVTQQTLPLSAQTNIIDHQQQSQQSHQSIQPQQQQQQQPLPSIPTNQITQNFQHRQHPQQQSFEPHHNTQSFSQYSDQFQPTQSFNNQHQQHQHYPSQHQHSFHPQSQQTHQHQQHQQQYPTQQHQQQFQHFQPQIPKPQPITTNYNINTNNRRETMYNNNNSSHYDQTPHKFNQQHTQRFNNQTSYTTQFTPMQKPRSQYPM